MEGLLNTEDSMGSKSKWIRSDHHGCHQGGGDLSAAGRRPQPNQPFCRAMAREKIGLLEGRGGTGCLERDYRLTLDYAKAGSWTWSGP